MSKNFTEEQIEQYVLGKADPKLSKEIENTAYENKEFKNALETEKSIAEAFDSIGASHLKTRLKNLKTPGLKPWYAKPASIAAGFGLLVATGIGLTFLSDYVPATDTPVISVPKIESDKQLVTIERLPEAINEESKESLQNSSQETQDKESSSLKETVVNEKNTSSDKVLNLDIPEEADPEIEETKIKVDDSYENLDASSPFKSTDTKESLEVAKIDHKKYDFHYKLSGDKLFLYGDFDNELYEILEVKKTNGSRFYLNFNKDFFSLESGDDIKKLKAIKDPRVLESLKMYSK